MKNAPQNIQNTWFSLVKEAYLNLAYYLEKKIYELKRNTVLSNHLDFVLLFTILRI